MSASARIVRALSYLLAALAAIASAGGIFIPALYRDAPAYKLTWIGNDWVTLALVVPALLFSIRLAGRGSAVARVVWAGLLGYLLYNYAFYLLGTAFNAFFLLYAALFFLSIYALAIALWNLDLDAVGVAFSDSLSVKPVAVYLALIGLLLGGAETAMCASFWFTGQPPAPPSLIFALDLSLVVPNMLLAAFLLWKGRVWGYVVGVIMLIKGVTYGAVLTVNALLLEFSNLPEKDKFLPFYLFVLLGSLFFTGLLLRPRGKLVLAQ